MIDREFTVLFPFCGLGAGALGFLRARGRLFDSESHFRSLGGIDVDPLACKDFVYLTESPALCADIAALTPARLVDFAGQNAPDVVFLSAPCKGSSKLLSDEKAKDPKYEAMNRLAEDWIDLMLRTWKTPPALVLFENVPNVTTRAAAMLSRVRKQLRAGGYLLHDGYHECGELGGLAQRRRRWLMVARLAKRCSPLLYEPPKKRVRACGEVLGGLPLPNDPAGGPMHALPTLSWLNWIRLALIPAGGDWRDLPGVLEEGQERRAVFKRHEVSAWDKPTGTIAGGGTNGVANVADPRVAMLGAEHIVRYAVVPWAAATSSPPRDVRAELRVKSAFDRAYAVVPWDQPTNTIAGGSHPGQGTYSVADPRLGCSPRAGAYGVLAWDEAAKTVTGAASIDNGPFAVSDPRLPADAPPVLVVRDARERVKNPPPVILAKDGTWHRPLTTLELAALQGMPTVVRGEPLKLAGASTNAWRERIGNAVPPPAAEAIAVQMLVTLQGNATGAFSLSGASGVWVVPEGEPLSA